jgi:hypothetical protein
MPRDVHDSCHREDANTDKASRPWDATAFEAPVGAPLHRRWSSDLLVEVGPPALDPAGLSFACYPHITVIVIDNVSIQNITLSQVFPGLNLYSPPLVVIVISMIITFL